MHRVHRIIQQVEPEKVLAVGTAGLQESKCAGNSKAPLDELAFNSIGTEEGPLKWAGWGFNDTKFEINDKGHVALTGSRYMFSGQELPALRPWMEKACGMDVNNGSPTQKCPEMDAPILNEPFLEQVKGSYDRMSTDGRERLFHGHGHTCQEIYTLRFGKFARVPDVVIYPRTNQDVEVIVKAAHEHNVALIPFGGGTSVSHALLCPEAESRMIVSLDMHLMCHIKWIDRKSMMACIEGGVIGKNLEAGLKKFGLVIGHEPDSAEFSTLGGWVATRASGMRKNKYGNIEDIVQRVKVVTPTGTFEKKLQAPRVSIGPDVNEFILGSEGTLGVVTEVVVRVRPAPPCSKYGSIIFPDFESGVACFHQIAMERVAPVSIRLVDNDQFQFGQVLKPPVNDWKKETFDKAKKWYVIKHMKFDPDRMVAATLLMEGTAKEIKRQEAQIYSIAAKYGGMKAGEENGIRGYFLTYMIAYLRDFGFEYKFMAESFETSIPWDKVLTLCNNVKRRIREDTKRLGVRGEPFVSARVTQLYDTGACVYFYFGYVWEGLEDPVAVFSEVEHNARDEILKLGGSLSHHHGIGKLRKSWMEEVVSPVGMRMLRAVKSEVDPKNIFANGNLGL